MLNDTHFTSDNKYSFCCLWICNSFERLLMTSSLAFSCIFKWAIVSSWASNIALHSSIDSEYIGGSSKQKNSRTVKHFLISLLLRIVLMKVCSPAIRVSMKPLEKLFPNHFFFGSAKLTLGNIVLSLICRRVKSVKRRRTSQKLFFS